MWLLPSRGREEACQQALDAFAKYGSTPGVLYVHKSNYGEMRLPEGWIRVDGGEAQAGQMRWLFDTYPNEPWYGWIADDNRPATQDFDLELIKTADRWNFVFCNGGDSKKPIKGVPSSIPSAMMWGGDLVRDVGWWAPPWVHHTTIDEHWKYMTTLAGKIRYRDDVVIRHLRWQDNKRERDDTDRAWLPFHSADLGKFHLKRSDLENMARKLACR